MNATPSGSPGGEATEAPHLYAPRTVPIAETMALLAKQRAETAQPAQPGV